MDAVDIKATGRRHGYQFDVEIKQDSAGKITVLFDGKADRFRLAMLESAVADAPPIANNYRPEAGSVLGYYHAICHGFFDKIVRLDVEGALPTIPYEPGIVY